MYGKKADGQTLLGLVILGVLAVLLITFIIGGSSDIKQDFAKLFGFSEETVLETTCPTNYELSYDDSIDFSKGTYSDDKSYWNEKRREVFSDLTKDVFSFSRAIEECPFDETKYEELRTVLIPVVRNIFSFFSAYSPYTSFQAIPIIENDVTNNDRAQAIDGMLLLQACDFMMEMNNIVEDAPGAAGYFEPESKANFFYNTNPWSDYDHILQFCYYQHLLATKVELEAAHYQHRVFEVDEQVAKNTPLIYRFEKEDNTYIWKETPTTLQDDIYKRIDWFSARCLSFDENVLSERCEEAYTEILPLTTR